MHEVVITLPEGHGLDVHTADIDALVRDAIGDDCYGISINPDAVRIHLSDEIAPNDDTVNAALAAIEQFYEGLGA
jgi:hypothetical protein